MKAILLTFLSLSPIFTLAAAPAPESQALLKALVNNPSIVAQLHARGTDTLTDVQQVKIEPGQTDYTLHFVPSCFCPHVSATVKIFEDLRPTYADGAPVYEASVSFVSGR